jgi:beta-glucosidase
MTEFAPVSGMSPSDIEQMIDGIISQATLSEKIGMMSGKGFFKQFVTSGKRWGAVPYRAGGGIERLGIAPFYFTDGPRGVARDHSTCFPCTMARGASFDVDLEQRIGAVMGIEARAQGCDLSGAVCVNLLRHPGWGRAQETYGEDPCHLGIMGAALAAGIQTHNVAATVKHLALNSMENVRFSVDVQIDERTLHEVYLPHFQHIIASGIKTVMSAYNKVNGVYCGEHRVLLTDILRGEWGFDGFVHSDWVKGVYTVEGVHAGLDVENPEPLVWGDKLLQAVEAGTVSADDVDLACRRILRVWYAIKSAADPQEYTTEMVASAPHRALAREAAEKSVVLLKNNDVLPLGHALRKLAVLGDLAALENTGDFGSSRVQPPYVITPLQGIKDYLCARGGSVVDPEEAEAIVVVVGYTAKEEGEFIPGDISLGQEGMSEGAPQSVGGDRASLNLPDSHVALIKAAAATGKPVIVVIIAGSAVMVEAWHDDAGAILQSFYSGMEGGAALARLLFGDVSPSGRLPFTVAEDAADYPYFDRAAKEIIYDTWHGYAKLIHDGRTPRYAFGHGLSYTHFTYANLTADVSDGMITVAVDVTNAGLRAGDDVVQCYVGYPGHIQPRARFNLKAFARVSLKAGEARRVTLKIPSNDLRARDIATHGWALEPGAHQIMIMTSAADPAPLRITLML